MSYLNHHCSFAIFDQTIAAQSEPLDCGVKDLNEFFTQDAFLQAQELLCKNFCFYREEDGLKRIVAAFTLSNDSIKKIPNARKKKVEKDISSAKHYFSYPAVMIGRLCVDKSLQDKHVGRELMDFIKAWYLDPLNKSGCRFLLVDSYKTERNFHYYESNGFDFLFGSEEQEKEFRGLKQEKELKTRLMYFDLKTLLN